MQSSASQSLDDLSWTVSKLCNAGNCVEIATDGREYFIGDSKTHGCPVLAYSREAWITFVDGVKRGDFEHLS
jgi:hypothetical protein